MLRRLRWLVYILVVLVLASGGVMAAFIVSPWPSAYLLKRDMDAEGPSLVKGADAYIPTDLIITLDQSYGPDGSETFDVFRPPMSETSKSGLPVIVWVHGGAFIAGDKADIAGYLKILAGRGYVTVGLNYGLAPGAPYPAPVEQLNRALAHLSAHAADFHLDPSRILLAGDSAGAQIAAQLSAVITDPAYAAKVGIAPSIKPEQLRGAILLCGIFDVRKLNVEGSFGGRIRTAMWAYFGAKDLRNDPRLDLFSVRRHVSAAFPATFISAGNHDPLIGQSEAMAKDLEAKGVSVHEVFFPENYEPSLDHQYQFDLSIGAARDAFNELTAFLVSVVP